MSGRPSNDPRHAPSWAWAILALLVLATAAVRLRVLDLPLDRDEGEYAYFGQLILQGIPPYAEAYNFKLPGIYAVYALILAVFGQTATGIHLGLLIVNAVTIILVFLLARRLVGARGAVAAGAAFAALSLSPRLFYTAAYAEHFVLPPVLAGLLVLLRALDRHHASSFLGAGLLFGAALLVKQSAGAFVLAAVLYVLLGGRTTVRRRVRAAALLTGAALAPFAALCMLMLLLGTFASFWFWTFTYAIQYATLMPVAAGAVNLGSALRGILPTSYLEIGLASIGLSAFFWDREARANARGIALLLGSSVLAVSPGLHFRHQYFIFLLPAVAILAGNAVESTTRRFALSGSRLLRYVLPFALAAVPPLHLIYLERAILFTGTPRQVLRALYGTNPFPESVEIAEYIRKRTAREDRIAVIGSEPQIYFYAGRRAATGYVYTYALMEPHPYAASMQRHMIREIEAQNPRFMVFVKVPSSWLVTPESDLTIFHWFEQYQKRFDRVGIVEIVSLRQTRYVWGAEVAAYTPSSDAWLAIFERKHAALTESTGGQ